jgi:FAD/FMN-containing dehydrogenase
MYHPDDGEYRPKAIDRCFFMESVDRDMAQTIVDRLDASDASLRAVQLRVLGGEMARVADDATAFAHRQKRIMAIAVNFFEGPEDYAKREAWVTETVGAMRQGVPGVYVGFLREEGPDRLHEAYPGKTWDRLAAVKAEYDPDNVFCLNQNILPKAPA